MASILSEIGIRIKTSNLSIPLFSILSHLSFFLYQLPLSPSSPSLSHSLSSFSQQPLYQFNQVRQRAEKRGMCVVFSHPGPAWSCDEIGNLCIIPYISGGRFLAFLRKCDAKSKAFRGNPKLTKYSAKILSC